MTITTSTVDTCPIGDCSRPIKTRGWCGTHYERWRRNGDFKLRNSRPLWDRFWEKVDASGDCWEWTAATNQLGYGQIGAPRNRARLMAHRVAWELLVGPIPEGLELDHLCKNPGCVNPDHLDPVTHAENMRRGEGFDNWQRRKTHCPRGHEYSRENTYVNPKGSRECRTCRKERR